MSHIDETSLARGLRIQLVDHIGDIDLPGFLIDTLENSLADLNAYKLTNLVENSETFITYLHQVSSQYTQQVITALESHQVTHRNRGALMFLTDAVVKQSKSSAFGLSKATCIHLQSVYSLSCLLMIKEFTNRRTASRRQQIPTLTSSLRISTPLTLS